MPLSILLIQLITHTFLFQSNLDSLLNKTWQFQNKFAGHQYVFFESENGIMKTIKQINGSGVCVVKSEIYDIQLIGDSMSLTNGLDLNSKEGLKNLNLYFNQEKNTLTENGELLKQIHSEAIIYNWATAEICDKVDYNKLLKINTTKNGIYDLKLIKTITIPSKQ